MSDLKSKIEMDYEDKLFLTKIRIQQWYEHWDGMVSVSFSGGKDSTVLLHLVRSIYPEVPGVFGDTGLEMPEIRNFVKTFENVFMIKPKRNFRDVVLNEGYPIASKMTARKIRSLQNPTEKNEATRNYYLTGVRRDGEFVQRGKLADKWKPLIDSEFKISERCCDYLKKEPMKRYAKETGRKPFIGTMAAEGGQRKYVAGIRQCNMYDSTEPTSTPMMYWTEDDVWRYIKENNVEISTAYTELGERRTGCMFCAFGVQLEDKDNNRFQRMAFTHPKQYKYCIEDLGMGKLFDFTEIPYKPTDKTKNNKEEK